MNTDTIDMTASLVNVALHLKPSVNHKGRNSVRDQALHALDGAAKILHVRDRFESLLSAERGDLIALYLTCCGHLNTQSAKLENFKRL